MAGRRPGWVEIDCSDPSMFRSWSAAEFYRAVDLLEQAHQQLEAGGITRAAVDELEMCCGLNRNPQGLISDSPLRHTAE